MFALARPQKRPTQDRFVLDQRGGPVCVLLGSLLKGITFLIRVCGSLAVNVILYSLWHRTRDDFTVDTPMGVATIYLQRDTPPPPLKESSLDHAHICHQKYIA